MLIRLTGLAIIAECCLGASAYTAPVAVTNHGFEDPYLGGNLPPEYAGDVPATAFPVGAAPNGWAPLEWMTIWGLDRCGQRELARDIAERWVNLNVDVYKRTGKLMEKYNVVDLNAEAGGGEYPGQDGFGWTNGVLLALINKYGLPK